MSNLGLYQKMTTWAKKMGGPVQLAAAIFVGGYIIIRPIEAGVKLGWKKYKISKSRKEIEDLPIYTVNTKGKSNEGVSFSKGDTFKVLEVDGDAALIELIGDKNNPYFASVEFLKAISDYQ